MVKKDNKKFNNKNNNNRNSQPENEPVLKTLSKKKEKQGSRMHNKQPMQIKDKQKYKTQKNESNNKNFNSNKNQNKNQNQNQNQNKFNNKNRKKFNGRKDKEEKTFNDEIEISNKPNDNFFDFSSNENIFTKLKNTNLENLKEERKNIQQKANEENNKKLKSWAYDNYIDEESHFLNIKNQRQSELHENLKKQKEEKEEKEKEKMQIDDAEENEDFEDEENDDEDLEESENSEKIEKFTNEEIAQLEKERKMKREIKPDLKEELEKKNLNKIKEDSDDEENEENTLYQDKFESAIYSKNMSFYDFNLSKLILRGCSDLEFFHPTKVQEKVIPLVLRNEDIFVNSETGSGKTACYLLPIIQKIITNKYSKTPIKALVILPTRELAFQCGEMLKELVKYVDVSYNLITGGMSIEKQNLELKSELDIIIATPGRLIDMIYNYRSLSLEFINILVLDEADKLLEMGFKDSIMEIISLMKNNQNRQNLLFSATLNPKIVDLGKNTLKNPTKIKMAESAILKNLKQKIVRMTFKNLDENDFEKRMAYLVDILQHKKRTIVFFNTKKDCHKAFIFLEKFGLKSGELHGDIDQTKRLKSLNDFQNGLISYLLASDIAGRGIDIEKVKCVVNYQMPLTQERYTHRVGRTARKGYSGEAITICNDKDRQLIKKIMKKENFQLTSMKINNSSIKGIYKIICDNKHQVNLICAEEEAEKEMDRAEKDVTKAFNMSNYKEEIMNKPKKTWYMNGKDKKLLSEKMKEDFEKNKLENVLMNEEY